VFETVQALWLLRKKVMEERETLLRDRVETERMFRKASAIVFEARGWDLLFSGDSGPLPVVGLLVDAITALPEHGITPGRYRLDALETTVGVVKERAVSVGEAMSKLESDDAWHVLKGVIQGREPPGEGQVRGIMKTGRLDATGRKDLGVMEASFRAYMVVLAQSYVTRTDLDIAAMSAFFRYALDMKFLKVASPFLADKDPSEAGVTHLDQLVESFEAFIVDPEGALSGLVPTHPEYQGLMDGLAEYEMMAEEGEFPKVPRRGTYRRGSRGKSVRALKARLAREGYFDGDVESPVFGEPLEKSVTEYESTHGFTPDGVVEKYLLRSLNVPIERRIDQIGLSLQRWRESDVRPEEEIYVRVNIAAFMMEVWDRGQRVLRHRVVVGNNNWDHDPERGWEGRLNRTKIFSAEVERVILNPRWYVPRRIHRLELDFEILSRPDYYAEHRYKVEILPDGRERVYQESGNENALGRVKFVFPNPYGIFMHDTPHKHFFNRDIRAYSHGCIRLHDPLDVAYFILKRCKGIEKEEVDRLLATEDVGSRPGTKAVRVVELDTTVPIFVEYNSVGVDEQGRMLFFSDIYRYDRDYFAGKIPYSEEDLELLRKEIPRIY